MPRALSRRLSTADQSALGRRRSSNQKISQRPTCCQWKWRASCAAARGPDPSRRMRPPLHIQTLRRCRSYCFPTDRSRRGYGNCVTTSCPTTPGTSQWPKRSARRWQLSTDGWLERRGLGANSKRQSSRMIRFVGRTAPDAGRSTRCQQPGPDGSAEVRPDVAQPSTESTARPQNTTAR